jgi:DNA-binding LacI/PurR family transcriptional regulator
LANGISHRVTVAEIAERLALSPTTVSLALSGRGERHRIPRRTIDRVQRAAQDMGYRPNLVARQLAGKRSNAIGVLISTEAVADVRLIQAMELLAAEHGIRFIVGQAVRTQEGVKEYLDDFRDRGVDGIFSIFHNHPRFRDVVLPELAKFENVVYFEKPGHADEATAAEAWFVEPDYYRAGQLGVQYLLDRGRERIGLVLNNRAFSYAVHRYQAYADTLKINGRHEGSELAWIMDEQPGVRWTDPFTEELALRAIDDLVGDKGADALVVVNDLYAARVMRALHQRGLRVPADVAIVGCDNLEFAPLLEPPLTTLDLHGPELAQAMMDLMLSRLDGKMLTRTERQRVIAPDLVVRQTA